MTDFHSKNLGMTETMAAGIFEMAQMMEENMNWNAKIIVVTGPPSGFAVRMVSKFRPPFNIIAITEDERTALELNLVWGVRSVWNTKIQQIRNTEERNVEALRSALQMNFLAESDHVIIFSRSALGRHVGSTCCMYSVKEIMERDESPYLGHN